MIDWLVPLPRVIRRHIPLPVMPLRPLLHTGGRRDAELSISARGRSVRRCRLVETSVMRASNANSTTMTETDVRPAGVLGLRLSEDAGRCPVCPAAERGTGVASYTFSRNVFCLLLHPRFLLAALLAPVGSSFQSVEFNVPLDT